MNYRCNILLGRVTKTSGFEGAVVVRLERSFIENIPQIESVFVEIDGRPVPFFIYYSDYSGSDTLKLKFIDYDTSGKVELLRGCRVFLTDVRSDADDSENLSNLSGYEVLDANRYSLGHITEVIMNPGQLLLKVLTPIKKDLLIPLHEDLVVNIDKKGKTIIMKIPDGLTDIN